jgi:hypothetical protein
LLQHEPPVLPYQRETLGDSSTGLLRIGVAPAVTNEAFKER